MAPANLETVRHVLEAFDRRDRGAWLALHDEQFEVVPADVWPEVQTIRGPDAAWDFYLGVMETFAPISVSKAELVEAGTDKVLTRHNLRVRGKASGAETDFDYCVVTTLRDGKVVRNEWFTDGHAALQSCQPAARAGTEDTGVVGSANVELVRSILAHWERGDYSRSEWAHPQIEYTISDGPTPGRWTGLAGMAEGARVNLEAWADFRFAAEEYRELDDERVLVLVRWSGRGRRSGVELDQVRTTGAQLFHVRDGLVTKFIHYWDRDRALVDLDLAPKPGVLHS